MLLSAAIVLVVLVIGGAIALIALDMQGRPAREWLHAAKDWQPLVGAVLGFLGAAGVLVFSNEMAAGQRASEQVRAANAIGYGLALETEQLAGDAVSMMGIVDLIQSQPVTDWNRTCTEFIATMQRVLPAETPVYDSVLGNLVDFGDNNLSLFVRFYGVYDNLLQEARSFDTRQCNFNGMNEVSYVRGQLRSILLVYEMIAEAYGTIAQPVPPAEGPARSGPHTTAVPGPVIPAPAPPSTTTAPGAP